MIARCLYCYQPLDATEHDFHASCSRKIFGTPVPPVLPYTEKEMGKLANEIIQSQTTVTGVQAKLSLHIASANEKGGPKRFTIVGLWGGYILKPPTKNYVQLPQVEDLTMHLASIAKIKTVPHSLIRLQSGQLAYITKRVDRDKKQKLPMEDMCQLTERLTEDKYRGSYEQIAKTIVQYSTNTGLDVVNFWEQVLFSFLTGNADMHLKNFSLITLSPANISLAPAYDLVNTKLVNPGDKEELALNLNGKKNKIKKSDWETAFTQSSLDAKQQANIFQKMAEAKDEWLNFIDLSFLTKDYKKRYKTLVTERMERMGM